MTTTVDTSAKNGATEGHAGALDGAQAGSSVTSTSSKVLAMPDAGEWQWLFSAADMQHTPSVLQGGLTVCEERALRWKGAQLIFRIGDYMRLGNHVTTTATIFFHRFYMRRSMPSERNGNSHMMFAFQEMAPTCIFLACKVEETHKKLHAIIEATMATMDRSSEGMQRAEARMYRVDVNSHEYRRWKNIVLLREERLLALLCFDLIVHQPHPLAVKACRLLGVDRELARLTVLLLNCCMHGAVCTFYDAATLAAAAFSKACRYVDVDLQSLSQQRAWTEAFDVDQEEVDEAMGDIDEHLEYHHARVQQQLQRAESHTQAGFSSAKSSVPSTPLITHHTSHEHGRDGGENGNGSVDSDVRYGDAYHQSKRAHITPSGEASREASNGARTDEVSSRSRALPHDSEGQDIPRDSRHSTPKAQGWSHTDREEGDHTACRPLSRRGARDGQPGPPPPLNQQRSHHNAAAVPSRSAYAPVSPRMSREDVWRPSTAQHTGTTVDARGPASHRNEVHEKVAHEQAQQERHRLLSPKVAPAATTRDGDESEEEGAL